MSNTLKMLSAAKEAALKVLLEEISDSVVLSEEGKEHLKTYFETFLTEPSSGNSSIIFKGELLHKHPLPTRLRVMATLMHCGAAWGFCGEATWLQEAADKLEEMSNENPAN